MLCTATEMLSRAQAGKYAVPAFDISNMEMMCAVLDACEQARAPALLMALEVDLVGRRMNLLAGMVEAASKNYSIPICLHLDHGSSMDSVKRAIDAGFHSVMYDGSYLPFARNVEMTAQVAEYAHRCGVSVEAELGHVGNAMVGNEADGAKNEDPEQTLTRPEEAQQFVEWTGVDALAVAIGTSHGVYQRTPTLRIDRLRQISKVCSCPLVLHGGSGTPEDQMKAAIRNGITKINIFSDVLIALNTGLRQKLNSMENPATWPAYVFEKSRQNMMDVVTSKLTAYGCVDRVSRRARQS